MSEITFCKGKTTDKMWPYNKHSCKRKSWKDGYCKTHHPDEKLKKHKQRMAEKEKLYQQSIESKKRNRVPDLADQYQRLTVIEQRQFKKLICKNL